MKFCEKVKEARTKAGLKQDEFAKAIGVSLRTVSNYEAGTRYPKKRETYYKMAEVLKVDVNYLLTDDEEFLLNAESTMSAGMPSRIGAISMPAPSTFSNVSSWILSVLTV